MRTVILLLQFLAIFPFASYSQCGFTSNPNVGIPINVSNYFSSGEEGFTGDFQWDHSGANLYATDVIPGSKTLVTPIFFHVDESEVFLQFDLGMISDAMITGYTIQAQTGSGTIPICNTTFDPGSEVSPASPTPFYITVPVSSIPFKTYFKFEISFFYSGSTRSGMTIDNFGSSIPAEMGTLPVKFESLQAVSKDKEVLLEWRSVSEQNVKEYVAEKSADGKKFTLAGAVSATGASDYSFTDRNPFAISFYRVKAIDHDGRFIMSEIVKVKSKMQGLGLKAYMSKTNLLSVQHIPAVFNSFLDVFSSNGQLIATVPLVQGSQQSFIELHGNRGLLVIRLRTPSEVETIKLIN